MSKNAKNNAVGYRKWLLPILAAFVGIFLLIFGSQAEKDEENSRDTTSLWMAEGNLSAADFATETEEKIVEICSDVSGAGRVRAVVTLEGGYRAVYASDVQGSDGSYRNQTVLTGSGNSEQAILVGYESPRIVGIGIVCAGGDDPTVQKRITMLVSAAFDVSANKIYVTGGS